MIKNNVPLLLEAANFEPSPCLPVKSLFPFCSLASIACTVISGSEEVPIQFKELKCLTSDVFLTMDEGTVENAPKFHTQIKPMSSVLPVTCNAVMIRVGYITKNQN